MRDSRRRVRREIVRALRSPVSDRPTVDAAVRALNANRLIEARILARDPWRDNQLRGGRGRCVVPGVRRLVKLSDTGQIYVTERAAKTYAEAVGLKLSEARHELTELLMEAHPVGERFAGELESWRYRSRTEGLDISAQVARKPNLSEVVAVNVRFDMPKRGGKRHRE